MSPSRFRLYLDETGTDDLSCVHKPEHRYLGLSGIMMPDNTIDSATTKLDLIKREFFPTHPDEPRVVFHRAEMVRGNGAFRSLQCQDTRARFDRWWLRYLEITRFTVITVVIDKLAMTRKTYWTQNHPYHYGMSVIVEKYAQFLERENATGDIMPEKRMGKKDVALQTAYTEVWANGTRYAPKELVAKRIPAKTLKFRSKTDNITGLQIADSIANPSCRIIRHLRDKSVTLSDFDTKLCDILVRPEI